MSLRWSYQATFPLNPRHALICLLILTTPLAVAETTKTVVSKKASPTPPKQKSGNDGNRKITPTAQEIYRLPTTTESVTSEKIDNTINAMTAEDTIKYLPSIQVRKRYIGDTNAPVGWRTSAPLPVLAAWSMPMVFCCLHCLVTITATPVHHAGIWCHPRKLSGWCDVGPFAAAIRVIQWRSHWYKNQNAGKIWGRGDIKSTWQDYGFYARKILTTARNILLM